MRGWFEIRSESDPRFNKTGQDFVCPHRGALNFDRFAWVELVCKRYGTTPPRDLKYMIFWEGEEYAAE